MMPSRKGLDDAHKIDAHKASRLRYLKGQRDRFVRALGDIEADITVLESHVEQEHANRRTGIEIRKAKGMLVT